MGLDEVLDGELVSLRKWRQSDLPSLLRIADNPRIASNLRDRFPHPYTRDAGVEWLDLATNELADHNWAISVGGELAGGIGLIPQRDINAGTSEIGYWLGESFWGRGFATDALRPLSTHAFTRLKIRRLFATVFVQNVSSCRVLEKAGYSREALLRHAAVKHGIVQDQFLYARIVTDR